MVSYNAAVIGAYYVAQIAAAEASGRLAKRGLFEPTLPVYDVWDLGIGDAMAICFWQVVGNEWRMVDYEEHQGKSILEMIKVCQNKPYVYGGHFAPHDITAREMSTGKTRQQQALEVGWNFQIVPSVGVQDGIDRARAFWSKVWIDALTAAKFQRLIPQYSKAYDEGKRCFLDKPNHDWTCHGADAFRYSALVHDKMTVRPARKHDSRPPARIHHYYRKQLS
jgi:hypothetical protein